MQKIMGYRHIGLVFGLIGLMVLAAIITPEAKPSIKFSAFGWGDLKNTTVAAPSAVTSQVPSVATSARKTR